jgi:aminoglycoside phosphotransferase (APT) family kinase protein
VDPPGGGICPVPLRQEYAVYERLATTEIPVPKPLWFEEAAAEFGGRPCMVRELVEGVNRPAGIDEPGPAGDAAREAVCREHARTLARLHTLDWEEAGFGAILPVPLDAADAARHEVRHWRTVWRGLGVAPEPELTRAVRWLEAQAPLAAPRLSLLKGNNGVGEEIWRDGKIVAMADWELAAIGDPAADWAFSQGTLDLWDREQTLAAYAEAAGYEVPAENMAWYRLWTLVKVVINARSGLRGVLDGRDPRPTLIAFGLGNGTVAAQTLVRLMGLGSVTAAVAALEAGARQRGRA